MLGFIWIGLIGFLKREKKSSLMRSAAGARIPARFDRFLDDRESFGSGLASGRWSRIDDPRDRF